jgi:hypothetical protein
MSETKFTKGPWHYDADFKSIYNKQCNYICDAPLNNAADKHLIAAAPEMYALLDEISDGLLEAGGCGNCVLAKRIEALLAKARGEL